ncbi:MAG: hypothetical protein AAGD32_12595 [Planctomycetota bacterium]
MTKTTTLRTTLVLAAALVALPAFAHDHATTTPATQPSTVPSTGPATEPAADHGDASEVTAQQVIDAYIEATGGRAAYETVAEASYVIDGKIIIQAQGIEGTYKMYRDGEKMLMVADIPNFGEIKRGYDGETFWESNLMTGARIVEGAEKEATVRESGFDSLLNPTEHYESMTVVGTENVNGEETHKVELVDKLTGETETRFYSIETGLLLKATVFAPMPGSVVETTVQFDNYKEFLGILMPTETTQSQMGGSVLLTVSGVSDEFDLGGNSFDVPDELK